MKFRSASAAALIAAVVASGGTLTATSASAVSLGGSSSHSSSHHKKSSPKKHSSKKKASKKKSSKKKSSAAAKRAAIVKTARKNLHVKYRYGGTTRKGWDCSGFTRYVYGKNGIKLPHSSSGQKSKGHRVSAKNAKAGDLIWSPGHVAIKSNKKGKMFDAGGHRTNTTERSYAWMVAQGARFIRLT
ncbi:C40 family peptidase [Brevibacterium rongguiense]|nr:NlpC/P60 family protein [Brevibacterium rongguiense]